jgi:hypothetical protein
MHHLRQLEIWVVIGVNFMACNDLNKYTCGESAMYVGVYKRINEIVDLLAQDGTILLCW